MKKIKTLFALTLLSILSLSCSGSDDSSPSNDYFFKAKIDGVQFTGTIPEFGATKSGSTITIACVQGIHKFQLKITNIIDDGVGVYTIPATTTGSVILTYEDDATVYASGDCGTTGTLTITSVSNNKISGTFSYTAGNTDDCLLPSKNITQGSFKAIFAGS